MKHLRLICLFGLIFYGITSLPAQSRSSYIIQLAESATSQEVSVFFDENNINTEIQLLAKSIRAYQITSVQSATRQSSDLKSLLERCPGIITYQPNRTYHRRSVTPNDPKFPEQWYLDLIKMPEAWELTTGTITSDHYQPVIGVLEAGYDISRPDFEGIIFTNPGEIPGNGIDDDNNGFIDDVHGWNFDKVGS